MTLEKKRYLDLQEQEDIYLNKRRSEKGFSQIVYRSRDRQRPKMFDSQIKYSFMQYSRLVFEWAKRSSGLDRDHIELLLYVQPIGIFNKFQVEDMCKTVKLRWGHCLSLLKKRGFIKTWREKKGKQHELFTLTQKGSLLCTLIHKMIIGEEKVPDGPQSIFNVPKKASNEFYLSLIKEMDKKKAERDSNPS